MARRIEVEIVGDSRSLERAFARSERSAKTFQAQITRVGSSITKGFAAVGVAVGVGALVKGLESAVTAASNLQESLSKSNVVFGTSAKEIETLSKTTATAFGLSQQAALETSSSFGALFGPLGITGKQAADTSRRLTELGADLASFYNTDVASALDAIRSGLVGESEPLRRYGALLSETRVQAQAMADTGKTVASSLTDQEKVLARVELMFKDTAVAQGDFARTSGGFAGQMKVLNAQIDNMRVAVGELLLPKLTAAVAKFNEWLADPENKMKVIGGFTTAVEGLSGAFQGLAASIDAVMTVQNRRQGLKEWLDQAHLGFVVQGPFSTAKQISKAAEDYYAALDKLSGKDMAAPPPPPSAALNWQDYIKGLVSMAGLLPTGGAGPRGGATAGSFLAPDAFSGPILKFLDKYKQANDRIVAAKKAADAYEKRMESKRGWLDFGLERAQATKKISDDRLWLRKIEAYLKERIRHEGRKLELVADLWRTRQKIRDLNKKQASTDPLAGLMQVSTKQLTRMLAAGTGLGPQGLRVLGGNIAGAELVVHSHVHIDGAQVAQSVTRHQARSAHRTAAQTSGYRG